MPKIIRPDLVGVVYTEAGVLKAGDTVPRGVTVDDDLCAPAGKGKSNAGVPEPG